MASICTVVDNRGFRPFRFVGVAVPGSALLLGAIAATLEPRAGLLSVALVLGWTQSGGL